MKLRLFRKSWPLISIFLAGVVLFAVLIILDQRIVGSDDTVFQSQILPYPTILDWVSYRYESWSGRIFSEAGVYIIATAPIVLWKLITIGVYAVFTGLLFWYYRLSQPKPRLKIDAVVLTLFMALPFLIDKSVLSEGGLWVTGSIVYFWMTTLGMLAFYPIISYVIRRQRPHWVITAVGLIAGVIAASSQEQVGAVLFALVFAFTAWLYIKERVIARYLIVFALIILAALLVSLLAPGNELRLQLEVTTWLPDLYTTPVSERIVYGFRWLLDAFINHSGFLLAGIWASMAFLFQAKPNKDRLDKIVLIVLAVASIILIAKGFDATSYLFNFYSTWKAHPESAFSLINTIPWAVMLAATVIAPLVLFRKQPLGYLISLLVLASLASAAILLLSPTMYASLWRAFFVPSAILLIILSLLVAQVVNRYTKYRFIILAVILSIAGIHFFYQIVRMIHNFY